ncbi:four helix bundle protein [Leptolyngbya iicbica]|uniref:Four helix bundle protein n=2 Tax=Cyanophyceae TaxID=3028117 RepID=A0A4V2E2U0_9CYAN|nr:four helix bundle protein [Leptolyngbya sp. LK]RZM79726.1 four helix bundle protein [Leptolyngbya sp. LK]
MGQLVRRHEDLEVYQLAFDAAMQIFELSKQFPVEERYSLTDQMRRSSRSVCANLAEAWRKRIYEASFVAKLSDCTAEAAETQTWIEFAVKCKYLDQQVGDDLKQTYDRIIRTLIKLIQNSKSWTLSHPLHTRTTSSK